MTYLCVHGYFRGTCSVCNSIEEAVMDSLESPEANDIADEFLYDYYLDQDERLLRESEEN